MARYHLLAPLPFEVTLAGNRRYRLRTYEDPSKQEWRFVADALNTRQVRYWLLAFDCSEAALNQRIYKEGIDLERSPGVIPLMAHLVKEGRAALGAAVTRPSG